MKEKSFYLCSWIEDASKNEHAFITQVYPSNDIKIWTFLKKKIGDKAEVVHNASLISDNFADLFSWKQN